ncbi:MAG: hypothetical protein J4A00_01565 [Gammaproteobacteria bacterium]|nr:hypothetical protein [Gammaproteobacteria bacterium]
MNTTLPAGFEDLQKYVPAWNIEKEAERNKKRLASTMEELQDYYDTLLPRMDAMVEHLNQFPLDSMPESETALLQLALMFMEVSPAIELFHQPDVPDSFEAARFEILEP